MADRPVATKPSSSRRVAAAAVALVLAGSAGAQGISPGEPPREGAKFGGFEPVLQLRTYYFDQVSTSGAPSRAAKSRTR